MRARSILQSRNLVHPVPHQSALRAASYPCPLCPFGTFPPDRGKALETPVIFPHIFLRFDLKRHDLYDILISVKSHKYNIGRRSRPRAARTGGMGCKAPRVGHCEALRHRPERISQIRRIVCAAPAYTGTASASDRALSASVQPYRLHRRFLFCACCRTSPRLAAA